MHTQARVVATARGAFSGSFLTLVVMALALGGWVPSASAQIALNGYVGPLIATATTIPARAADPESFLPAGSTPVVTQLGDVDGNHLRDALIAWDMPASIAGQHFCGGTYVRERAGGTGADRWELSSGRHYGPVDSCTVTWTPFLSGPRKFVMLQADVRATTAPIYGIPSENETSFLDLLSPDHVLVVPGSLGAVPGGAAALVERLGGAAPSPTATFTVLVHRLTALTACDVGNGCDFQWISQVGREAERTGAAPDNQSDVLLRGLVSEGPYVAQPITLTLRDRELLGYDSVGICSIDLPRGIYAAAELLGRRVGKVQRCGDAVVMLQVQHVATAVLGGPSGRDLDDNSAGRMLGRRELTVGREQVVLPEPEFIRARSATIESGQTTAQLVLDVAAQGQAGAPSWLGRVALSLRWAGSTWRFDSVQNLSLRRASAPEVDEAMRAYSAARPAAQPARPIQPPEPMQPAQPMQQAQPTQQGQLGVPVFAVAAPGVMAQPTYQAQAVAPQAGMTTAPFLVLPITVPSVVARLELRDRGDASGLAPDVLSRLRAAIATAASGDLQRRVEAVVMQQALAAQASGYRGGAQGSASVVVRSASILPTGRLLVSNPDMFLALGAQQAPSDLGPFLETVLGSVRMPRGRASGRRAPAAPTVDVEARLVWQPLQAAAAPAFANVRAGEAASSFGNAEIVALIRQRLAAVRACYETQLRSNSNLAGTVTVTFTVQPNGAVSAVGIQENTTGDAALAGCVTGIVSRFRWNPGPAGGPMTFAYPFAFAPSN